MKPYFIIAITQKGCDICDSSISQCGIRKGLCTCKTKTRKGAKKGTKQMSSRKALKGVARMFIKELIRKELSNL